MPPRSQREPPEGPGAPPPTTLALYEQHWKYVFRLLPGFGIWGHEAAWEVAQDVWLTVHRRIGSYDPRVHPTPRAWLTIIVWRCAANYRRAWKRWRRLFSEGSEAELDARAAPGLNPEEAALLRTLEKAIVDDDQRHALILQACHGLTVSEIAAVQGVSESQMERRLTMARKHLTGDGEETQEKDETKAGAFLGFGSLEALGEALRPKKPIPDEVGEELWNQIEEQIQQQDTGGANRIDEPPLGPLSSFPPVAAVPALGPTVQSAAMLTFTKGTLGLILAGAFLVGNITGAGAALAWQAYKAERYRHATSTVGASFDPVAPAAAVTSGAVSSSGRASSPGSAAPVAVYSASGAIATAASPSSSSAAVTSSVVPPSSSFAESKLLLLQMRRAAAGGSFALVLTLADKHARQFGAQQATERETERIRALRGLGRGAEAEEHARVTAATYPEQRRAMVRAIGHVLP